MTFGEYLRSKRKEKKMTIRQLAVYSGISNAYISQIENGERGIPSPEVLKKLAGPLGVPYEELMEKAGYIQIVKPSDELREYIRAMNADEGNKIPQESIAKELVSNYTWNSKSGDQLRYRLPYGILEKLTWTYRSGFVRGDKDFDWNDGHDGYEFVDRDLLSSPGDGFVLIVNDDGMSGDSILSGDRVVVKIQEKVSPSDIAVVGVKDKHAILRRVTIQDQICILTPSNPSMPPMLHPIEEVHIIGKVVEVRHRL
jgi:repressor LexA